MLSCAAIGQVAQQMFDGFPFVASVQPALAFESDDFFQAEPPKREQLELIEALDVFAPGRAQHLVPTVLVAKIPDFQRRFNANLQLFVQFS